MIEGRNNNAVHHIEFSEHVIDFLLNTRILKDTGFQLNIRDNIRILHQLQILSQCRHFLWSMLLENIRSIQLGQLFISLILDIALAIRCTIYQFIMHDNQNAVLSQMNIILNTVHSFFNGFAESQKCILRVLTAETAVRKILSHIYHLLLSILPYFSTECSYLRDKLLTLT